MLKSDEKIFTSNLSGVSSLLNFLESKEDFSKFSAADKVVGRGAALLYVLMNIKEIHALVMSEKAKEILDEYSIPYSYDSLVPHIINRYGDGICPIEKATDGIINPAEAYKTIKTAIEKLRNKERKQYTMKKLGLGCMRLPLTDKENDESINLEKTCEMVDEYLKEGFNYFDTAYMYHKGNSERIVKEAIIKRHDRSGFFLATKMPVGMVNAEEDVARIFEDQKEKTGAEYFDYYLFHCLNTENYEKAEKYKVFEYLAEKKKSGEIKRLGFSFHDTADVLDKILTEHPEMEFVQLQINYLDWENPKVQSRLCYEVARKHGKDIIIMEPVRGGKLANVPSIVSDMFKEKEPEMSVASWAIRFCASLPGVISVLSGMSDIHQLRDNISYMKDFVPLTEEETDLCLKAGQIIANDKTIPCTSCRYCAEECVKKIAIPEIFTVYNQKVNGDDSADGKYKELLGRCNPADCIECKKCEKMCPQKIEISKLLKTVSVAF